MTTAYRFLVEIQLLMVPLEAKITVLKTQLDPATFEDLLQHYGTFKVTPISEPVGGNQHHYALENEVNIS